MSAPHLGHFIGVFSCFQYNFFISMAIVIGPTPPGTGVIAEATGNTLFIVYVAAEMVCFVSVNADIDSGLRRA